MTYFPEAEFEEHRKDIDQQITAKFWSNAVNPTEYKYVRLLYTKLEIVKNIVKREVGLHRQACERLSLTSC